MKFILLTLLICSLSIQCLAQDTELKNSDQENSILKNEVKINLAYTTFGYLEGAYERILPRNSSVGIAVGKSLIVKNEVNFHLLAFSRLYFSPQQGSGFFIEANLAHWDAEDNVFESNDKGYGIGFSVGGKFLRGKKWLGEIVLGVGKTLNEDAYYLFNPTYPRYAIHLGRRF